MVDIFSSKHAGLHVEHEVHVAYMRQALEIGHRGEGRTSPNPAVGAIIVAEGEVVGRGYHPKAGDPHAEIFALREAGIRSNGADLYVTLEPCSHFGRTAPCCDAIIAAGIRCVFVGICDPNPLVNGRGVKRLRAAGVEVVTGILETECRYLCAPFIKHVNTGHPLVILKSAITLDGKTSTSTGSSQWITGEQSRAHVHQVRDRVDAILVGIGTVQADNPRLNTRLEKPQSGRDPIRVVLDSHLRIDPTAALVQHKSSALTLIMTTANANTHKRSTLEAHPLVEVVSVAQDEAGHVDLRAALDELGRRNIQSVLIEGGAKVNQALLQHGLVDRIMFYIAPKLLGGADGNGIFAGKGPEQLDSAHKVNIINVRCFGEDILIEGEVSRCLPV